MLKKLFGGKKEEFFIQLDETNAKSAEPADVAPTPEAPVAETEVTEAPEAPAKAKKTSIKKSAKQIAPAAPAKPAPVAAAAKVEPQQVEFATQYLLTQTLVRRQPGPSLNKFKAMARQVKTR
ncbi:hypothetical protein [Synechocystis sp. LKSZ1]|uniref:hypothetical protein n=1 Tax=Synechocystis sp. LKSZ1 TaxID=3144951 RepID=UPI00336BBA72